MIPFLSKHIETAKKSLLKACTGGVAMASDSESAEEMWEVGPTEDVVQALIETLVDPRLPFGVSPTKPPSDDEQRSVARQMHAVVLLYNYYHRKQKPELEFLDFISFCKLAVALRQPLTPFMTFMKISNEIESMEWNGSENQLSVTEKAIKDACEIALALDASTGFPNTESWPVSKIAVLLIDTKKENCLLKYGAVTEGVWSLLEKEIADSNINLEISVEEKVGNKKKKRKRTKASDDSEEFLQLAYDVVKAIPEHIVSSELEVLKTHVTYSLSKEKSACQFYMMQCSRPFNTREQIPLKFLVESLQGPLAEKVSGGWCTNPVVEYYHILPYGVFLSSWLLGKELDLPSLRSENPQRVEQNSDENLAQSSNMVPPASKCNEKDLDCIVENRQIAKVDSCDRTDNDRTDGNNKKCKLSSDDKVEIPANILQSAANSTNVIENPNKKCEFLHSGTKDASTSAVRESSQIIAKDDIVLEKSNEISDIGIKESKTNLETLNADCEDRRENLQSGVPLVGLSQEREIDGKVTEELNKSREIAEPARKEECTIYPISLDDDRDFGHKTSERAKVEDSTKTFLESEDRNKKKIENIKVYHHRRKNLPTTRVALGPKDGVKTAVEMDGLKSSDTQFRDEILPQDNDNATMTCNQSAIAVTGNQLAPFDSKYNVEVHNVETSEEQQNALALLYGKRQGLYSQICSMEDMLALYEDNIERIRDGGDVDLARECIGYIISGNDHQPSDQDYCKSHEFEKQTRLSDTFLPGKSSCQDLEYICFKNNWRLPRYFVQSANGKFQSDVMVERKDVKLSSKGELESNPCEARESAAVKMIAIIRDACD